MVVGVAIIFGAGVRGVATVAAWLVEVTNVGAEITGGLAISDYWTVRKKESEELFLIFSLEIYC